MKWQTPYQGQTYEFDDSRLSASEARLQKRVTAGMSPVEAERARGDLDPDAWIAALLIGMRRAGRDVDATTVIAADDVDLMAAARATRTTAQAARDTATAAAEEEPATPGS